MNPSTSEIVMTIQQSRYKCARGKRIPPTSSPPEASFFPASLSGWFAKRMLPGAEAKRFATDGDGPEESSVRVVREARLTAEAIVSAKRCNVALSFSPKALGRAEK